MVVRWRVGSRSIVKELLVVVLAIVLCTRTVHAHSEASTGRALQWSISRDIDTDRDMTESTSRPRTADEEVEAAEAAFTRTLPPAPVFTQPPPTATPAMAPAPAPVPVPTKSDEVDTIVASVAPPTIPDTDFGSSTKGIASGRASHGASAGGDTAYTPPPSEEKKSNIEAEGLAGGSETSTLRGSDNKSLDQMIILYIIGGVGALGVMVLMISRHISKEMGDYEDEDDPL